MDKLEKQIKLIINIYKSGALSEAERETKNLIHNNPKIAFLYNLVGIILLDQKKIEEAQKYFEQGIKIDPNFAMIYNNLGLLFTNNNSIRDTSKAEKYYKKSIELDNNIAEPYNNLGSLYISLNFYDKGIKCFKNAIKKNPNFSFSYYNLGSALISVGNFDDANKYLRHSIKLNPNNFVAHRILSRIIKYTKNEKHLEQLISLYNNKQANSDYKLNIGFALGKAYEDLYDFNKSFNYYKESNTLFRKKFNYSLKDEKKKFDNIKNIYNEKLFSTFNVKDNNKISPIFIVGMPRSGTTLIEQVISNHDKVFGAGEVDLIPELIKKINFKNGNFNTINFTKIGEKYIKKMKSLSNNSKRFTDKLPINFLNIGFIKLLFPNAKIINSYREPKDNILSIYKNHFPNQMIPFAYDLKEIVDYYNLYSNLMHHWSKVLPDFIYNVKYENLITNTKNEISNILKFCSLEWSDSCLNFHENKRPVKTASDSQIRSKIYNKSIGSWKNYSKFVNEVFLNLKIK